MSKVLAIALLFVLGAGATVAAGAATEPSQISAYGPGQHGELGGVGILGGPGNNQIAVRSPGPSTVVVSDTIGATALQGCQAWAPGYSCGCESIDATSVSCNTPYGLDVGARLMNGDDAIRVVDPLILRATSGRGADRMTGNARDDFLRSDEGRDRLSGRAGDDELFGGSGHDFAYGGGGDDLLWVHDRDRDQVIDCGPGNDRAVIDRQLDPEPLRCEHVRFGSIGG
jgi:Ca2+-binding RTX toxin-like protein